MNRLRAVFLWATDMSRNNTGNPIGSGDPRDREDNSKNLDQAMNASGSTWTDRFGVTRKTFKAAENAADAAEAAANTAINTEIPAEVARVTADANTAIGTEIPFEVNRAKSRADTAIDTEIPAQVQRATDYVETILEPETSDALNVSVAKSALRAEAARDAATVNADIYASTSDAQSDSGLPNGSQYQVVSADGLQVIRYRKDSSSASTELVRYPAGAIDALTVNKGKDYPLKAVSRAGIVSSASNAFRRLLLDAKVIGADPEKYYRIAYQQNGAALGGSNAYNWIIEVGEKTTYDSTGATEVLIGWQGATYGSQEQLIRDGGIQTVTLRSPDSKVIVQITLDASELPAEGNTINATTSGQQAYSWIIDPACYLQRSNADAPAFRNVSRLGNSPQPGPLLSIVILDVEVINAQPGYYYGIRYFKNGTTALSGPADGWAIEKIAKEDYATTAYGAGLAVINFTDPAPDVDRSTGIQTVSLHAPREELTINITLDASKLQSYGEPYNLTLASGPGGSWIIDPSRYKSVQAEGQLNALTVNRGKQYPLRPANVNGIVSAERTQWSDLLLDIEVIGAEPGKCYQLVYYQNGADFGGIGYGWIIRERNLLGLESDSSDVRIEDLQQRSEIIDRDGGIQTIRIVPSARLGLTFKITLDASKLPPDGTTINAASSANPGWSWIIDPSCYTYKTSQTGPAFRNAERLGNLTNISPLLSDVILDVEVDGAEYGYYYGIRYFKNGTTALSGPADGWAIEKIAKEDYASTAYTAALAVINYTDPAPDIDRSIGIQTITLRSTDGRLLVHITLDASRLQAYGSQYNMVSASAMGGSWIINPSRYKGTRPVAPVLGDGPLSYSIDSLKEVAFDWSSFNDTVGFAFGVNGANDLPNFKSVRRNGSNISTFATDWLPPLIIRAGTSGGSAGFTGGNHLLAGLQTAVNRLYQVFVDDRPVLGARSGTCNKLTFLAVNDVMAGNTVVEGRYVIRQSFLIDVYPDAVEVACECTAYEDLLVFSDYGPQLVASAFAGTMLFADGQYPAEVAWGSDVNSGAFSEYPNSWVLLLSSANGTLASWLDHSYGVGDGVYVNAAEPRIKSSGTKTYHAAVRNLDAPMPLLAGQSYRWRGGYALQGPGFSNADFLRILKYRQDGKPRAAAFLSASDYVSMP